MTRPVGVWVWLLPAYLALFVFNGLTRWRAFTPDSMNYVDVARNIEAGRGIVQSTLGCFASLGPDIPYPDPMTAQAVLYPVLIAVTPFLDAVDAALVLSLTAYVACLFLLWTLAHRQFGREAGLLTLGWLCVYAPLTWIGRHPWSDPVGFAFAAGAVVCLTRRGTHPPGIPAVVSAAVLAGMASATRFALAPVGLAGLLILIRWGWVLCPRFFARNVLLYLVLFAIFPVGLLIRNLAVRGRVASYTPLIDPWAQWNNLVTELTGRWAWVAPSGLETALLALFLLTLGGLLRRRGELGEVWRRLTRNPTVLPMLTAVLLILLLGLSAVPATARLIAPSGALLVPGLAFVMIRAIGLSPRGWGWVAAGFLLVATAREVRVLATRPAVSEAAVVAASERLSWLRGNTTDRDLVVGENGMDVPFYLGRTAAGSYSPAPWPPLAYDTLVALADAHGDRFDSVFLVVQVKGRTEADLRASLGDFVADLTLGQGKTGRYPRLRHRVTLGDGVLYEVERIP